MPIYHQVRDANGTTREILHPSRWRTCRAAREHPRLRASLRELRRRARKRRSPERFGRAFAALAVVVWLAFILYSIFVDFEWRDASEVAFWIILFGLVIRSIWKIGLIRDSNELVRGLVDLGHCASCAYDIRDIAPGADGRVTCPECGAAWRVGTPTS